MAVEEIKTAQSQLSTLRKKKKDKRELRRLIPPPLRTDDVGRGQVFMDKRDKKKKQCLERKDRSVSENPCKLSSIGNGSSASLDIF